MAQQFSTGDSNNVSRVSLRLWQIGNPVGRLGVQIWDDDGFGFPRTRIDTVATLDLATIPELFGPITTLETNITGLSPNSPYYLVLSNHEAAINPNNSWGVVNQGESDGTFGASKVLVFDLELGWIPLNEFLEPINGYLQMAVIAESFAPGDFNGDDMLDVVDLDALTAGRPGTEFDLNGDGRVDSDDRVFWISDLKGSYLGDADLNGDVSAGDLNTLALNWQKRDATSWAQGDFNGDGNVNASDLNDLALNWQNGVIESASRAAVPEATGITLMLLGSFASLSIHRRLIGQRKSVASSSAQSFSGKAKDGKSRKLCTSEYERPLL